MKTALVASIQRLYEKREVDNMADYSIESKDGHQIKVHPLILLSRYLSTNSTNRLIKIFLGDPCSLIHCLRQMVIFRRDRQEDWLFQHLLRLWKIL